MKAIQLEDLLSYNSISDLSWSPEGSHAAFILHKADIAINGYRSDLWVYEACDHSLRQLTWSGDVHSFIWDNEDELIFPSNSRDEDDLAKQASGEEWTAFYRLSLKGGCAERAFDVGLKAVPLGKLDTHVYVLRARKDLIQEERLRGLCAADRKAELEKLREERSRFSIFDEAPFWFNGLGLINKTRVGLFLYNSSTGELRQLTERLFDMEGVSVSPEYGKIVYHGRVFDTVSDYRTGIWVYDYKTGKTSCAVPQGIYRMRQVGWLRDRVVFAGTAMGEYSYSQTPALFTVAPDGGQVSRLYTESLSIGNPVASDVRYGSGTAFKTEGDSLYLISGQEDMSRLLCVSSAGSMTVLAEPYGSVDLFDVKDGRVLYVGMSDMELQELYGIEDGSPVKRSSLNEGYTRSHAISRPEELRFTDPDGFEIHGFVIKPSDYDPEKTYPAILDIHGGPRLSYGPVYYHEMQYWAAHGYFVFYANPRGSDGRSDEFAYIRGKYGTVEFNNLMQFTDEVLKRYPQIDPSRLGVAGGSYGGFMTNWIIGHTDRFAAAASQRSISNFVTMEGTSDCGRTFLLGHIGATTEEDVEKVWSQSPLNSAHLCTTPTLFIHAKEDYRCWYVEAFQMFTALRSRGIDSRLCLFNGENHELSRSGKPVNRIKRLKEITAWMDKYLRK